MGKERILKTIGKNVKALMNDANISSAELARRCQVSQGTISKVVNGNMVLSVPMAVKLAEGLGVDVNAITKGLTLEKKPPSSATKLNNIVKLKIAVMSINNRRITLIKNQSNKIIGTSELEHGLDLAETSGGLMNLIKEAIKSAVPKADIDDLVLKNSKINLVMQSFEFEETKNRFVDFAKRTFKDVIIIPDWQLTYLAAFNQGDGISLVTDKGVSLSYRHNGKVEKLGGWKFPVYDLGGENWLGVETIRHTIESKEGYIPRTKLADAVLAKFNGKIEKITETCFKGADRDVFCLFTEILLKRHLMADDDAKAILDRGFKLIYRPVELADRILEKKLPIVINGSLSEIYKTYFKDDRLIDPPSDTAKMKLLVDINRKYLTEHGITV